MGAVRKNLVLMGCENGRGICAFRKDWGFIFYETEDNKLETFDFSDIFKNFEE